MTAWTHEHAVPIPAPAERLFGARGSVTAIESNARVAFDRVVCGVPSHVTITLTPE